ncbi:hypothetical protein RxyAA322_17310 [Rubrobacter xylanophilus]|uniref:Gram-positive cocci surface proteins LPxTG domain-containing protein n=1 Tax=Rubrobacter xylanophilus TaxID=49319 RepID=A0A510HN23_9ACTN|nr:LPXTG cell wall anchor domain-containing protein [Rubrobacter xylanophilus]BBL79877.1 hypothetical protein RxyAA322_17310 [Rubrobacter xylanophilus]
MVFRVVRLSVFAALFVSLAAAPAWAQDGEDGGGATAVAGDVQVQYQDCDQVVAAAAEQLNAGDVGAVSGDIGSAAASEIAQELGISVGVVQSCLQSGAEIGAGGAGGEDAAPQGEENGDQTDTDGTPTDDGQQSIEEMQSQVLADTIPSKVLPATGGAYPGALLAGALLLGSGLLLLTRRR